MTNAARRKIKKIKAFKKAHPRFNEAIKISTLSGRKAEVVLIDEGLGNRVNMNYYGPEALAGAPEVFECAPCFTDHPSESENSDRPERSIWHKAGYFTNVRLETIEGKSTIKAVLTLDETETGESVLSKIKAAIQFKTDNPAAEAEYVGLSINATGESERRDMTINGEPLTVNYVTAFVKDPFTSVDIVTVPARGGRFLALLESISGARTNKMSEALKKLLAKLNEAAEVKTPEELKEKMTGIMKEAEEIENEAEAEEADEAFKKLKADHEALLKKHEDIGAMVKDLHKKLHGEEPSADEPKKDEPKKDEPKKDEANIVDMAAESEKNLRLVALMLKEANIPLELVESEKLAKKPIKAIEAEISRQKKIKELATGSAAKESIKPEVMLNDQFTGMSKI